jgi:hypothetical protein
MSDAARDLCMAMVERGYMTIRINDDDEIRYDFGPEPPVGEGIMHAFWHFLQAQQES